VKRDGLRSRPANDLSEQEQPEEIGRPRRGIMLTLGVASVAGTGIASADPQGDYLYDLNNPALASQRNTLLQLGYGACTVIRQNVPRNNSIVRISGSTALDTNDAGFLYDSAMQLLCP
jgi:hypothetical protein